MWAWLESRHEHIKKTMSIQNPNRHALYSHLYLYINLMECHTGRLWRRHLMPCQNITPVTVRPNFDGLPCQGMERFMSPICLILLTGGWVRPENGCTAPHSNTHTHWPIYLLFVHLHNAQFIWYITLASYQSVYFQSMSWNHDYRSIVTILINLKLHEAWQISLTSNIQKTIRQLVFYCW